jgi:hypothetical protein
MFAPAHSGTSCACVTALHVPVEQLWQASWQAMLQQTPSVQNPDTHSLLLPQVSPICFVGPTQAPTPLQVAGAAHSPSGSVPAA